MNVHNKLLNSIVIYMYYNYNQYNVIIIVSSLIKVPCTAAMASISN